MNLQHTEIDKSWTLFLDRDGVVNDGALDALKELGEIFGTIVVVTNQRGVGRGIMTMNTLRNINTNMTAAISAVGGRIDHIYACTAVNDEDHNRKPNTGMGLQAKEDFPEIDFRRSIIVGNSLSDMEFGKRLAMSTIFLTTKHAPYVLPNDLIDQQFASLDSWVESLKQTLVLE